MSPRDCQAAVSVRSRIGRNDMCLRDNILPDDPAAIRDIVSSTGYFNPAEVDIAVQLADERLVGGPASGYEFVFAAVGDRPVGYACFGMIPCTLGSFDLYWIAVHQEFRGSGIGRQLIAEVESRIGAAGGRAIYVDTSGRSLYESTRRFYANSGYCEAARFEDFYAPGDAKVVYRKWLSGGLRGDGDSCKTP
jgi:ribosomal protein S18 acetylase RimI-like enzyme